MSRLIEIRRQSSTSFFTALFIDDKGDVYDVVICHTAEENLSGFESLDITCVQHRGEVIPPYEYPWKHIAAYLPEISALPTS
jgi:hypothetical protein